MNIAKVKNSAAFVNYVKPELEMLEMEIEGAILSESGNGNGNGLSFTGHLNGNGGPNRAPETTNLGHLSGRSGNSRVKR